MESVVADTMSCMSTVNLWVDDDRRPPRDKDWTWVKTAKEAVEVLKSAKVEHLSLDYSLGYMRGTVEPVIEWMRNNYFPSIIDIHTNHPQGREWLIEQVTRYAPESLGDTTPAFHSSFLDDLY